MKRRWLSLCFLCFKPLVAFDLNHEYEAAEPYLKQQALTLLQEWKTEQDTLGVHAVYLDTTLRCNGSHNDWKPSPPFIGVCTIQLVTQEMDLLGVITLLPDNIQLKQYPIHFD